MSLSEVTKNRYQAVIGLEVHAQLLTASKAYSNDCNAYGAPPNTNVSAITLGHPGTLPYMNQTTIDFAIKMGLACRSEVSEKQHFARKNYFYPDLPKGYQITQDTTPICTGGVIYIKDDEGRDKAVGITRIHMEEDAGKSIHDLDPFHTLIDLNRAGVPLIEIVSEPDIRSPQEAYNYLSEVRKLVRYLDICDGNMEEGSLRCDANVSVMLKGATAFGVRSEIKNLNSIRNVRRAIAFEIERQIEAVESGEVLRQETRNFDAVSGTTTAMRTKEGASDYRYFPEPDLPPIRVTQVHIQRIAAQMPPLPRDLVKKYTEELHLSTYDATVLTDQRDIALYFEAVIQHTTHYKAAANWVMGEVKSYINEKAITIAAFPITPQRIAELIHLVDSGNISRSIAARQLFRAMLTSDEEVAVIASRNDWMQTTSEEEMRKWVREVFEENPEELQRFQSGEKKLMGFLMGQLMKKSRGKADPPSARQLIHAMSQE